jgi:hypothetical protein
MHAAIPTIYQGIRFRSRLEAKWACFFTEMCWPWEYEPIDLPGWIPDFAVRVPELDRMVLVECKPAFRAEDRGAQIKIEQAFGAPLPEELRKPWEKGADSEVWDAWADSLPYELMIVGTGLFPCEEPSENSNTSPCVGRLFQRGFAWWPWYPMALFPLIVPAWARATNTTQWRAPR